MTKDNESSAEARLEKSRKELAATQAKYFALLQTVFWQKPQEATKLFFEALLKKGDLTINPLKPLFKDETNITGEKTDVDQRLWGDLAEIVLNKIKGTKKERGEYVPLTQVIEDDFYFATPEWEARRAHDSNDIKRRVLHRFEEYLASATLFPCMLVYRGMPLFERGESGEFVKTSAENMDVTYIFMKGHYYDMLPSGSYPEWAKKYFFKNEHLLAQKRFFDGFEGDDEALRIRRDAFRAHIGVIDHHGASEDGFLSGRHQSRLMKILQQVLDRYYGDLFDENDKETWTSQPMIVDWLKKEFNLSDREAKSIDIVCRPDIARGK